MQGGTLEYGNPYVFVSYSSGDRDIVDQLTDILDAYKIDVWIDHEQLHPGDSFVEKIELGLKFASAIIIVLSENSTSSNWCKTEYEVALTKEINNRKALIIPIVIGNVKIPVLLSNRQYFKLVINKKREIIVDSLAYEQLAKDIKKMTVEDNISSMITVCPKEIIKDDFVVNERIINATSIIDLIISSAINDFPINLITTTKLIDGKCMKEIYITVSKFIEEYDKLVTEIINLFKSKNRLTTYRTANRKLKDIQKNMQKISIALCDLSGVNEELSKRFAKIANICVEIESEEGMALDVLVGYAGIKDNKKIPDLMPIDDMKNGGGSYVSFEFIEINKLEDALDKIYEYKTRLLNEIASQTNF